jgi:hypothetical protein
MQKIPTLFRRDPDNMRHVLPEVTEGCEWVLAGEGIPTRKYDGTCVMFDGVRWWARREVKEGKETPANFQSLSTDENTGKTVGWEPIDQSPFVKFWAEAEMHIASLYPSSTPPTGTYELYGPKINGNPEGIDAHRMVPHGIHELNDGERTYESIKAILSDDYPYEGIVWHHPDGRMAKIKRRDFT